MIEEHNLTERVRDVLFYARYYSSPDKPRPVNAEHILLALLLVDPRLFQLLSATESHEELTTLKHDLKGFDPPVRKSWLASTGPPPLSSDAKQVIALAAEESKRLGTQPALRRSLSTKNSSVQTDFIRPMLVIGSGREPCGQQ